MAVKSTFSERLETAITRDGALAALQLVAMVGIGAAIGSAETLGTGMAAGLTAAATASTVGFSAMVEHTNRKLSKKRLLDIYNEEIAALNHKPVAAVTINDLDSPQSRSNPAIRDALDLFDKRRNFYIGIHAVTALLLTAVVGVAAFALALVPTLAVAGVAGLLYEQTYKTVKIAGNAIFPVETERTITKNIREIADQIGLGGRISSTRVLGVFILANPELQAQIKERFNSDFSELTIAQKRDLVKELDSNYQLYRITSDLNTGAVNPTELAFLAYGQQSGVPRRESAPMAFEATQSNNDMVCYSRNPKADLDIGATGAPDHFQRLVRPNSGEPDISPDLKHLH